MGILLKQCGISDFVILEKDIVGSTFFQWPKETKFITGQRGADIMIHM